MANTIVLGIIFFIGITIFAMFFPFILQYATNGINASTTANQMLFYQILPITVIGIAFAIIIAFFVYLRK